MTVNRRGSRWALDLSEGIDLSIYLLGSFEPGVVRSYERLVGTGATVVDVGANIGAHTLPLAKAAGASGRVIAFEPTAWAFDKLRANLDLNPGVARRVVAEQMALVGSTGAGVPSQIYSSWPLVGTAGVHPQHRGRLMSTGAARATTLDAYLEAAGIEWVDFIKLDVDGAEPEVLAGARVTVARSAPRIIMELAPYIYDGTDGFERLLGLLDEYDYVPRNLRTGLQLSTDPDTLRRRIPPGSSMNVLCARP